MLLFENLVVITMKLCRKCNLYYENPELNFCSKCGSTLETINICPNCHTENGLDFSFCKKCGTKLNDSSVEETTPTKNETPDVQTIPTATSASIIQQTNDTKDEILIQTAPTSQLNENNIVLEENRNESTKIIKRCIAVFVIFLAALFFYSIATTKSPVATTQKNKSDANVQELTVLSKNRKVDRWEDVDVYVDDYSFKREKNEKGEYFKITVKQSKDGKVIKTNEWTFFKKHPKNIYEETIYKNDYFWEYKTDEMNNYIKVHYPNKIFEYCMDSFIGQQYEIANQTYIEDGHTRYGGKYYRNR